MRWTTRIGAGLGAAALVAAMVPAYGGTSHDRVVAETPADWTPIVEDGGGVWGMATVGDTTVVGGSFTSVRQRNGTTRARTNIFAFDSSGTISTAFNTTVNGRVWDIVPAGDGVSVYIAGAFTRVNNLGGTNRVARINVQTGEVMRPFRTPVFDNIVTDIQLANGRVYVGGYFKNVAGAPHVGLVALDAQTGALTNHLDGITITQAFRTDSTRTSVPSGLRGMGVERFSMTPDGSRMVAIGNFRTVSGQSRPQVAVVDTSGADATLTNWSTNRFSMLCSRNFPTYTLGVDVSPDGSYFVIGTGGAFNGGAISGTLCDALSRFELNPSAPDQQPTWVDYMGGDSTTQVHVTGEAIYSGGHYRWANNPYAADRVGPGTVKRAGLAAFDPRNGLPLSFKAGKTPLNWGVCRFVSDGQGLWVGHDGDSLGGVTTGRFGLLPLAGGEVLPDDDTGSLPGSAFVLGAGGADDVSLTPLTTTSAGTPETFANGGVDWSSARGSFMADNRLYTGWADGTFTWRPVNNAAFGTARNINLNGLTAFAAELPSIRAMWFDRTTGRLYFTRSGQSQLFYRYFTPESTTVGAVLFTAPANTAGINWSNVSGGFLAGGRLYYSSADGSLRSVDWTGGTATGTPQQLSGPGVDALTWGTGALALRVQ